MISVKHKSSASQKGEVFSHQNRTKQPICHHKSLIFSGTRIGIHNYKAAKLTTKIKIKTRKTISNYFVRVGSGNLGILSTILLSRNKLSDAKPTTNNIHKHANTINQLNAQNISEVSTAAKENKSAKITTKAIHTKLTTMSMSLTDSLNETMLSTTNIMDVRNSTEYFQNKTKLIAERFYFYSKNNQEKGTLIDSADLVVARDVIHDPRPVINGTLYVGAETGISLPVNPEKIIDEFGEFKIGYDLSGPYSSEKWTYTLFDEKRAKLKGLVKNESIYRDYTVTVEDGTQRKVSLILKGNNNPPTITGTDTGTVIKGDYKRVYYGFNPSSYSDELYANGKLNINDPDVDESSFKTTFIAGKLGTLQVVSNGYWSYIGHNERLDIQALKGNESLTETFTIGTVDGTPHNITITIQGKNSLDRDVLNPKRLNKVDSQIPTTENNLPEIPATQNNLPDVFPLDTPAIIAGSIILGAGLVSLALHIYRYINIQNQRGTFNINAPQGVDSNSKFSSRKSIIKNQLTKKTNTEQIEMVDINREAHKLLHCQKNKLTT